MTAKGEFWSDDAHSVMDICGLGYRVGSKLMLSPCPLIPQPPATVRAHYRVGSQLVLSPCPPIPQPPATVRAQSPGAGSKGSLGPTSTLCSFTPFGLLFCGCSCVRGDC